MRREIEALSRVNQNLKADLSLALQQVTRQDQQSSALHREIADMRSRSRRSSPSFHPSPLYQPSPITACVTPAADSSLISISDPVQASKVASLRAQLQKAKDEVVLVKEKAASDAAIHAKDLAESAIKFRREVSLLQNELGVLKDERDKSISTVGDAARFREEKLIQENNELRNMIKKIKEELQLVKEDLLKAQETSHDRVGRLPNDRRALTGLGSPFDTPLNYSVGSSHGNLRGVLHALKGSNGLWRTPDTSSGPSRDRLSPQDRPQLTSSLTGDHTPEFIKAKGELSGSITPAWTERDRSTVGLTHVQSPAQSFAPPEKTNQQPSSTSLFDRAVAECESGDFYSAVNTLRDAIAHLDDTEKPDFRSDVHGQLGVAFQSLGELKKAKVAYLAAVAEDPTAHACFANLALVCFGLGQKVEGKRHIFTALKLAPDVQAYSVIRDTHGVIE